jgi:hypothetical protein
MPNQGMWLLVTISGVTMATRNSSNTELTQYRKGLMGVAGGYSKKSEPWPLEFAERRKSWIKFA